jgi:hypothetical protein
MWGHEELMASSLLLMSLRPLVSLSQIPYTRWRQQVCSSVCAVIGPAPPRPLP